MVAAKETVLQSESANVVMTPGLAGRSPNAAIDYTDADEEIKLEEEDKTFANLPWYMKLFWGIFYFVLAMSSLYFFMVAVKWIGESFSLLLGCEAKSAFAFADNPIAGLMVGVVSTAMLHSSGTVTSITVALVGAKGLTVRQGVPIIMGANVGTCVTCIMVAFAQMGKRDQFERAMAAATVHDMYNIWSVIVLFPIELVFHPLELLSMSMSGGKANAYFESPVDIIVNPLAQQLIRVDKSMIEKVSLGKVTCEKAVFLKGGAFLSSYKSGSMSGGAIGGICLAIGFTLLVMSLVSLVYMLQKLFRGSAQKTIRKALDFNGYVNIFLGTLITFCVHSSTVVTSTLTPMAGLGLITLEQVYPIVIGANLGTTVTALLASWVTGSPDAVAIALVHFWFNIWGIFLFYPIPITRKPILDWARRLAFYSARWPMVAGLFLMLLFLIVPGIALALTYLFKAGTTGLVFGIIIVAAVVVSIAGFYYWYLKKGGREVWHAFLERKAEAHAAKHGHAHPAADKPLV
ncbi:hypothetical protein SDRG_12085 [Saprolegnia diclina VS20]|uniref:Sodium-dependent phosphate transporter n=1 Tax=Saprolegnia diclina (strain VS20) TaxID=1156394 RepID=T0Q9S4_SAPDV|nr:hypothetical protein SDRG_12085 [Saprolegnia diclina VS20]EQC30235.1 hypothetical protein SDRG_12085 [Saprolegnia diclina VS20]|eukprot:XP_008616367.1 hypothetical protein SDRG_12085 [Saprolegnia diclina VS20]